MRKLTAITLFIISLLTLQGCISFHSKLPNIIYIYADDLGYGKLGCYGQDKIRTPHLDRLASEGMRFTQHYTGAPVCAPARCMLMTGQHAIGNNRNRRYLISARIIRKNSQTSSTPLFVL